MDWKFDIRSLDGTIVFIVSSIAKRPPEEVDIMDFLEADLGLDVEGEELMIDALSTIIKFKYPIPIFLTWCNLQYDRLKNGEPAFRYYRVYDIVRAVWLSDPEDSLSAGFPKEYLIKGYVEE